MPSEGTALFRSVTDGRWSNTEEMLAWLVELADEQSRIAYAVGTSGKRELRKPFRVPRPYVIPKPKSSPREIARFFGATRSNA